MVEHWFSFLPNYQMANSTARGENLWICFTNNFGSFTKEFLEADLIRPGLLNYSKEIDFYLPNSFD
jgi:hypothetical protein